MSGWTVQRACRVLGIGPGASRAQIKRAWRRKALETHPDRGGSARRFREAQSAYAFLCERGPSNSSRRPTPDEPVDDKPLEVGSWLFVRSLRIDGELVEGKIRAQLTVVDMELLISLYLPTPREQPCGHVVVAMSESPSDPTVALYEREVVSTSQNLDRQTTVIWFSPFQKRMRIDGYAVGEEPPPPLDPRARTTRDGRPRF